MSLIRKIHFKYDIIFNVETYKLLTYFTLACYSSQYDRNPNSSKELSLKSFRHSNIENASRKIYITIFVI